MRSVLTCILIASAALIALKPGSNPVHAGDQQPVTTQPAVALAEKSGCFECHGITKRKVGPAFQEIAEKYKSDPQAHDALIKTVKYGGKGNWTAVSHGVSMPPHSRRLSEAEITRLVEWLLSHSRGINPDATTAVEALAEKSECFDCHGANKRVVGPTFREIAAKYKNIPNAKSALVKTVMKGGKGNWSEITQGVPMPPHSRRLYEAEIARLVDWVLGL